MVFKEGDRPEEKRESDKAVAAKLLTMDAADTLLNNLTLVSVNSDGLSVLEINNLRDKRDLERPVYDMYNGYYEYPKLWWPLASISVIQKQAQGKSATGDRVVVRSVRAGRHKSPYIIIGSLDGQTPVDTPDDRIIEKVKSVLLQGQNMDCVIPNVINQDPVRLDNALKMNIADLHAQVRSRFYRGEAIPFSLWKEVNKLEHEFLKIDVETLDVEKLPGMSGIFAVYDPDISRITQVSIADAPGFFIFKSGQVLDISYASNANFDRETVSKMRELIHNGDAENADEAKAILRANGHYRDSYRRKINTYGGFVPIVNGQQQFNRSLNWTYDSGTGVAPLAAAVYMSDGMISGLQDFETGMHRKKLLEVLRMLLIKQERAIVIDHLEKIERETWSDQNPRRERMSDDKNVFIGGFVSEEKMVEVANKLYFNV